ncbi:KPRB protein, partial [Polyodon spathula]|nr:KPRB protein [Polyodon spathula]
MSRSKEVSEDLRKTVIDAHQSRKGYKTICKDLGLHQSTVRQIVYKWRKFKTTVTLPRSGRPTKISPRTNRKIIKEVTKNPRVISKDLQATLALAIVSVHDYQKKTEEEDVYDSTTEPRAELYQPSVARIKTDTAMNAQKGGLVIFTANSNPSCMALAKRISERLGVVLGKVQVYQEANRETRVQIQESVRGKDVFIIQTVSKDVNTAIMEFLIMVYACKTSCARSIIGVIPYFPYSKQCKMRKRGSIVSKLVASMMCKAGLNHLITMDLHQKEIQGFFNIPVDNLRASPFLLQYIQEEVSVTKMFQQTFIKQAEAAHNTAQNRKHETADREDNDYLNCRLNNSGFRAQSFAERLRLGIAVIHGEAQDAESDLVDGRHSPPTVKNVGAIHPSLDIPFVIPKEKPPITVVGDVGGRIAIIVDDIIDDVDSFLAAADTLKERGAYKIYVMATHGILSCDAPRLIEESAINEVVVTNTIPHEIQKLQCPKIKTVDISMILSEAIRRIHNGESMSYLFRNIGVDD